MDTYEIKVIAIITAVVIALCVFTLVMELLRMKPGCCWISAPLEAVDLEKDGGTGEKEDEEEADGTENIEPVPDISSPVNIPVTPILKPESRSTPDKFAKQKRVKSASAVRFYAYSSSRPSSVQHIGDTQNQRKSLTRAKTAGHVRRFDKPNGYYGVTFANDNFEMVPQNRRSVTFTPASKTDDEGDVELPSHLDDRELEDEIPEDTTSTISLESKEPVRTTPVKPSTRQSVSVEVPAMPAPSRASVSVETETDLHSVSVETETEPEPRVSTATDHAGTQCEAFMLTVKVCYAEAETQTDDDPDFREETAVLREVKQRSSTGTQMKTPTPSPPPPPPPVCIDTACGPSTIDLIDPVPIVTPKPSPPQREVTPPQKTTPPKKKTPPKKTSPPKKATNANKAKGKVTSKPVPEKRKMVKTKSRGMNLQTAKRAQSGRLSSSSSVRPSAKSHPILKSPTKPINFPTRSMKNRPPREKWQIATERIYMQQRIAKMKPAKSNKLILGLKTAVSEVRSFTTPPPAVYEVTKGILLILGEKEEDMEGWSQICILLAKRGPASPVTRLVNLKGAPLTEYQLEIGSKVLDNISTEEITKVSTGASVLYKYMAKLVNFKP